LRTVIDPIAGRYRATRTDCSKSCWNLLTNAVKFTPKGGNVDVVLQRVNSQLELSVSDSGVGIPAEFLAACVRPLSAGRFIQHEKPWGLGLGLSIVKQLVELHGGSVRARSNGQGQGASFVVCLPPAAPRSHAGAQHAAASGDKTALAMDVDLRGIKVLVVDDEPDARDLIGQLLEECNAEVSTAESVSEALAMMPRVRPDLLVERHRHARARWLSIDPRHSPFCRRSSGPHASHRADGVCALRRPHARPCSPANQIHVVQADRAA